jgi:CSLREA domain-containing protein
MTRKSFWAGVAVLAAGLIFVTGGGAATMTTVTLTVNSTTDSTTPCTIANHKSTGTCTLRGAVLYANNLGNDNTMFVIKLSAKTYHLSQGTLDVDGGSANTGNIVQIVGATKTIGKKKHRHKVPASIIDGSGNVKPASVLQIDDPTQMSNVVITGGSGSSSYKCYNGFSG